MIELEVFQNELAVEFHDIETDLWLINGTSCYTEAAEQAKENIFQRAVKKIKELFQKVKDKITEFIQDREFKKLEKQLQENPELAKKTVKMPDYDKLHKLNKDTANKMTDKNCDPEKEMAKYKKQRNILLGAGAAVTISLGVALMKIKKLKGQCDESIKSLSKAVDELEIANREYDRLERVSEGNKKVLISYLNSKLRKIKTLLRKIKNLPKW